MSRSKGVSETSKLVNSLGQRQKPSWCLLVTTRYRMPAFRAIIAHSVASKSTGSNWDWRGM
jgi:hypothetical protein